MVTVNRDLLMAFVYFDQSHCGYLLEKDMEEILYTLGLHLSRAQVLYLSNIIGMLQSKWSSASKSYCLYTLSLVFMQPFCIYDEILI